MVEQNQWSQKLILWRKPKTKIGKVKLNWPRKKETRFQLIETKIRGHTANNFTEIKWTIKEPMWWKIVHDQIRSMRWNGQTLQKIEITETNKQESEINMHRMKLSK